VAAAKDVATQAIKDGYAGLKALVIRKFGTKPAVATAVEQVEKKPESEPWQGVLKEELKAAGADKDEELLKQAQALLDLLKQHDPATLATYGATLTGSGAIAQGAGAVAAGAGGVAVGGSVSGSTIVTGDHNTVGKEE
jgi:hypothetical protein